MLCAPQGVVVDTRAENLAEGFRRLAERKVIADSTAEALPRAVGLRNVVAHG